MSVEIATEVQPDTALVKRRTRTKTTRATGRPSRSDRVRLITLGHLDKRTLASQRALALISTLESEKGGSDTITEGVRQLCQRAALLGAIVEDFEARWLNGEAIDLSAYLSTVGVQRRVLISLGLQRQGPKDITPSLGSYLADREEPDDGGEGAS